MQGSFWKTVAVVGVIGIGGLAILEVQKRLDQQNAQLAPDDAEALAAKILASGEDSVTAPLSDSEFDKLMADTQAGQFALSQPNSRTPDATTAAFPDSEPTSAQNNTPVVDTSVDAGQLAQGGNPFFDLSGDDLPADDQSGSVAVAAGYQSPDTPESVATVAFTEEPAENAPNETFEEFQPFRREGVVQAQPEPEQPKPDESFPFFNDDTEQPVSAPAPASSLKTTPDPGESPGIQFFPGNNEQSAETSNKQTAQFFAPSESETAEESSPPSELFQNAPPFDGSADTTRPEPSFVPFREEPVASDNPPTLKSTPDTGLLHGEDAVPAPRDPQFDGGLSSETPIPDFSVPAAQPDTANPTVPDRESLPFVEDVPSTTVPALDSNSPGLSIPTPENSLPPEPRPDRTFTRPSRSLSDSAPSEERPIRTVPEPNSLQETDNSLSPFREDLQPNAGDVREFGTDVREFGSDVREFGSDVRELGGNVREFGTDVREFGSDTREFGPDSRQPNSNPRQFSPEPMNLDIRSQQDESRDINSNRRELNPSLRDTGPDNQRLEFDQPPRRDFGSDRDRGAIRQVSGVMRPNLVLEKEAPENATVGTPLDYHIYVSNEGDATAYEVVVEDEVTAGARVEGASPAASRNRQTNRLIWEFDSIQPRETKKITVRVTPTGEGMLDGVATVKFKARVKATTVITAPKLRLQMLGPDEVRLGEEVSYRYVITNEGSGEARDVYVRTVLPDNGGLKHPAGRDLEYEITSLKPAEQREIVLAVVAAEPGEYRAQAEVTAAGGARDQAMWKTNIIGAQLKIARRGPKRRFVGRPGMYENIISNETNVEAIDARVTEKVPEGMRFVSATKGGDYNAATRTVTWQINRVGPGKVETLQVELMPTTAGARESVVTVFENAGIRSEDYVSTTQVEDLHNVSADISQLDGPVAVGETFGFTISIDNRGTADATDVELTVAVPPEIKVIGAGSREIPAKLMQGNQVQYNLIVRIEPNRKQDFELKLQGVRSVRNGVVKASVRYKQMTEPLVVSESVTVYRDEL